MPILPQQPEQPVLLAETEAAPTAVNNTVNGVAGLSHGLSLGPIAAPQSEPSPGPGPEADWLRMPTPDLAQPLAPAPTLEPEPLQSGPPSSEPQVPIVWTWPGPADPAVGLLWPVAACLCTARNAFLSLLHACPLSTVCF